MTIGRLGWKESAAILVLLLVLSSVVVRYRMRQFSRASELTSDSLPYQFLVVARSPDQRYSLCVLAQFSEAIRDRDRLLDTTERAVEDYQSVWPTVEVIRPSDANVYDFRIPPAVQEGVVADVNGAIAGELRVLSIKTTDRGSDGRCQVICLHVAGAEASYDYVYEGYAGKVVPLRYGDFTREDGYRSLTEGVIVFLLGSALTIIVYVAEFLGFWGHHSK